MRTAFTSLLLIATFLLGCVASQIAVPAAPARDGTKPQRWEYACTQTADSADLMSYATDAGAKGWEMVAAHIMSGEVRATPTWCFKRPL